MATSQSHPGCHGPSGHVCQKPSGHTCVEAGCNQPAGTLWGPLWCPVHDVERLDGISQSLTEIAGMFDSKATR
jgi:hypothetical protein